MMLNGDNWTERKRKALERITEARKADCYSCAEMAEEMRSMAAFWFVCGAIIGAGLAVVVVV